MDSGHNLSKTLQEIKPKKIIKTIKIKHCVIFEIGVMNLKYTLHIACTNKYEPAKLCTMPRTQYILSSCGTIPIKEHPLGWLELGLSVVK